MPLDGRTIKGLQELEMLCYRRILNILYKDHITSEDILRRLKAANGERTGLLSGLVTSQGSLA